MLELQKFVLARVCDDLVLFKKELRKSLLWLNLEESTILRDWVLKTFGATHGDAINEVLSVKGNAVHV
jgi:hypothetical protein